MQALSWLTPCKLNWGPVIPRGTLMQDSFAIPVGHLTHTMSCGLCTNCRTHSRWCCRVLASQASAPLILVPVETIFSMWYGEHSSRSDSSLCIGGSKYTSNLRNDSVLSIASLEGKTLLWHTLDKGCFRLAVEHAWSDSHWQNQLQRQCRERGMSITCILRAGQSEQNLQSIFRLAEKLDGCLIFLDEIDSLATARGYFAARLLFAWYLNSTPI